MSKRVLAMLMALVLTLTCAPSYAMATDIDAEAQQMMDGEEAGQAKIGDTEYASIEEAITAAATGETVEITEAGTYTLPAVPQNITIKGAVDGVVFEHTASGNIASIPNGATFENVTFEFGQTGYHGFQHAGTIKMNNCTLNGLLFSYGDMIFTGCTFNQTASDYIMWAYAGSVSYVDCVMNGNGKFVNVYRESTDTCPVSATGCTFNSTQVNKAVFNVKESSGETALQNAVSISNCTTNENFPGASETDALVVLSPLVQVDDRLAEGSAAGGDTVVSLDGEQVYATEKKYGADESGVYHVSTAAELEKVKAIINAGSVKSASIVLDADIDMSGITWTEGIGVSGTSFTGTFDGQGHKISNLTIKADQKYVALFGAVFNATIKNVVLENPVVENTVAVDKDYTGTIAGAGYAHIENCQVIGGTVTGGDQVGGIIGYLSCGYVKNCTVDGTSVTAGADNERVGGIAGKANVDSDYEILSNTVKNATIKGGMSAALVGQIMTGTKYKIADNMIIDTEVLDSEGNAAFNPIGNFRSGSFDANAVTDGKITHNEWSPATEPNYFDMVNPADSSQYVRIQNVEYAAKIGSEKYETIDAAIAAAGTDGAKVITLLKDVAPVIAIGADDAYTFDVNGKTLDDSAITSAEADLFTYAKANEDGTVTYIVETIAAKEERTKEQIDALKSEIASLTEEQQTTQTKLAEMTEAQKKAQEQIDTLESTIASMKETDAASQEEMEALKTKLATLESELATLKNEQAASQTEINDLKTQLADEKEAQQTASDKIDALESTIASMKETDKASQDEIAALKEQLASMTEAQEKAQAEIDALTEAKEASQDEIDALKEQIASMTQTDEETQGKNDDLQSQVDTLTKTVDELRAEIACMKMDSVAMSATVKSNTSESILISWNENGYATGYYVEKLVDDTWTTIATIEDPTVTSYIDTDLKTGTKYSYAVVPYLIQTNSDGTNTIMTGNNDARIVMSAAPSLSKQVIKKVAGGKKYFAVRWTKVEDASGYQVQYSTVKSMKTKKTVTIKGNSTVVKKITKLQAKKYYYVRVRTYKKVDGKTVYGAWSTIKRVKTK